MNASLFATRHPDLAAAVAAIVDVDWVKRIYRPVRCREDLAFGLAVVESELAWVGWAINGLLVVAKALVDAVESRMLGSHWLVVVGVCLGLSYVGAKGYVRLLWDRRWVKRTLRRVDAGLRPVQDGGAA